MKSKKKAVGIVLGVVLLTAFISVFLFMNDRSKRFDYGEKSSIAMGTVINQKIYSDNSGKHISHIIKIIDSLEDTISWREIESDVAVLNETGKVTSGELADILSVCIKISEESDGAFDVTVGEISNLWSIGEEGERIPSEEEIKKAKDEAGYKSILIEGNEITLLSDCRVDLGAIGKGLACDYVSNYLNVCDDINGAVVSVGGSNLAYGSYNKAEDKWRVAVRNPRDDSSFLGVISMSEGFVSTSGDYERYFEKDGVRYHHILDARTGYPSSSGLISVTVVCRSGLLSDALSTACFVLGEEKSLELLNKYEASAIFVREDMSVSVVGEIEFEKM